MISLTYLCEDLFNIKLQYWYNYLAIKLSSIIRGQEVILIKEQRGCFDEKALILADDDKRIEQVMY